MGVSFEYIAGFFDGEGCVAVLQPVSGKAHARITIVQKDPEPLHAIQEALGGIGHLYLRPSEKSGAVYRYNIAKAADVRRFAEAVGPFCLLKREQLELACQLTVKGLSKAESQELARRIREITQARKLPQSTPFTSP